MVPGIPDMESRGFVPARGNRIFGYIAFDLDHSLEVARLNFLLGKSMGLSEEELLALYFGGLFHDAGKGILPRYLLTKDGRLSDTERRLMRAHPAMSFSLVVKEMGTVSDGFFRVVADCCLYHHERLDGSGYPVGLKGKEIPFHARVTAVADVYAALIADRPYRKRLDPREALEVVKREAEAGLLDMKVVEVLASVVGAGFNT